MCSEQVLRQPVRKHCNTIDPQLMLAGEVRVYNEQHLVSVTPFESPVNAMTFGKFGREDNTLISVTRTGTDNPENSTETP